MCLQIKDWISILDDQLLNLVIVVLLLEDWIDSLKRFMFKIVAQINSWSSLTPAMDTLQNNEYFLFCNADIEQISAELPDISSE